MNRLAWGLLLSLLMAALRPGKVLAQIRGDTLTGVQITSSTVSPDARTAFQPGARVVGIDSALLQRYRQQSVATLLSQVSSVFIKSYGFNSLATLSFRGASSAQSAVYWEGVPLMNGATGLSDVSLLPVAFSDSISIQYGGSGALGGSGNVGGALLLQSKNPGFGDEPAWKGGAQLGWGSFHQVPGSASVEWRSERVSVRARGVWLRSDNDFPAVDETGRTFTTENAAVRGEGVLLESSFKVDSRNTLSLRAWQQAYRRQIPRALFEASSQKEQDDEALRFLLDWKHTGRRTQSYAKAAFLMEDFHYRDPSILLETEARTKHYFGEGGVQGRLDASTSWLVFTPIQFMELEGSSGHSRQLRAAVAGNMRRSFLDRRLSTAINARAEVFDNKLIGLPGIGAAYQLGPGTTLRASLQRSYRIPTLNELFYEPGGNETLKPEHGWSTEAGVTYSKAFSSSLYMTSSLTAYDRRIKDWIIWLGGAIWTPHNLAAVHSRGLEWDSEILGQWRLIDWRLKISAAYTRSTPTESYLTNDNSIGMQIPYTPLVTGSAVGSAGYKGWTLTYVQNYAGARYITADESASLEPYSTGNVLIGYLAAGSRPKFGLHASIQNIWNSRYSVVAYRPMPGINYLISISIGL